MTGLQEFTHKRIRTARQHGKLKGGRALLAAVIGLAVLDVLGGNAKKQVDGLVYFHSDIYQQHLSLLGLHSEMLPEGLEYIAKSNWLAKGS